MIRHALATLALVAVSLAVPALAHADDVSFASLDDIAKKKGTASAFLVVVAKDDSDLAKTVQKHLGDPKLAKLLKDDVPTARIDPADEAAAKQLGIPVEKAECLLSFDGYGLPVARHQKAVTVDTLATLVKKAQEVTKKKRGVEKKLDAAVKKGEAAMKASQWRPACDTFLSVVQYKATVPCGAITTAEKHLEELSGKGLALLTQAKQATGKHDFSKAHKLITEATNDYPTPAVLEEAKAVGSELGMAEKNASGK